MPVGPTSPARPATPAGPLSPAWPAGPTGPCGPAGPISPAGPFSPAGPAAPGSPLTPAAPAGPVGPTRFKLWFQGINQLQRCRAHPLVRPTRYCRSTLQHIKVAAEVVQVVVTGVSTTDRQRRWSSTVKPLSAAVTARRHGPGAISAKEQGARAIAGRHTTSTAAATPWRQAPLLGCAAVVSSARNASTRNQGQHRARRWVGTRTWCRCWWFR